MRLKHAKYIALMIWFPREIVDTLIGSARSIGVAQLFAQERQNMFLSPTAYQARQSLLFKSQ